MFARVLHLNAPPWPSAVWLRSSRSASVSDRLEPWTQGGDCRATVAQTPEEFRDRLGAGHDLRAGAELLAERTAAHSG